MKKFITIAEMRDLGHQLFLEQITYSRMIEILNEKAEQYYKDRMEEDINKVEEILTNAINKAKQAKERDFAKGGILMSEAKNDFRISGGERVVSMPQKGMAPYDNDQYLFNFNVD
jgi:hypothetical protein